MESNKILKNIPLIFLLSLTIFFSACSSKKLYEPNVVAGDWQNYGENNATIVAVASNTALLDNGEVLTQEGRVTLNLEDSFRVLSKSDGWIISANIDGNLSLQYIADESMQEKFELKKTIATASVKDDILAVLFADNEMALYSIATKDLIFKEKGSAQKIIDSRVVNPYFMNDLVLFFTLDGKIVIISSKVKKRLRTVIVSSEDNFNNIIYSKIVDNKIVAATGHKILSMGEKEIRAKYELRNLIEVNETIYLTTKQGELISLTPDLQVNKKVKFPFAHFLGMIEHNNKIYLLEKAGYLIEMSKDLLEYKVYEVDLEDGYVFIANKKFYIDDQFLSVE